MVVSSCRLEMETSIGIDNLTVYLGKQLEYFFPDQLSLENLHQVTTIALKRLTFCLENTCYTPYWRGGACHFSHLNADQYTIFVYYCSNVAYSHFGRIDLATKLFYLNKALHSFHCMFDTLLPDIFLVVHGAGTVLGKAVYSNFFVVMHGCTVGANSRFETPVLGEYLLMYPNSSITGNCQLGKNVCMSNGAHANDEIMPDNSLVFGSSPNLELKANRKDRLSHVYSTGK